MAAGLLTSYVMTKHAVVGLSLALRSEAAANGVGVTVVCPSAVDTPILDKGAVGRFHGRDYFLKGQGVRRPLDPDVLAEQVLRRRRGEQAAAGHAADRADRLADRPDLAVVRRLVVDPVRGQAAQAPGEAGRAQLLTTRETRPRAGTASAAR